MYKPPMNSSDLQDMIQRYRTELVKANQKKALPDEKPSAPILASSVEAVSVSPENSIETPMVKPVLPMEQDARSIEKDNLSSAVSTNGIPPPDTLSSQGNPAFEPITSPEPLFFWSPPCMQDSFPFSTKSPVQESPVTDGSVENTPSPSPVIWPYNDMDVTKKTELSVNTPPVQIPTNSIQDDQLPSVSSTAALEETYRECDVSPCPSAYWPQAVLDEHIQNVFAVYSPHTAPSKQSAELNPESISEPMPTETVPKKAQENSKALLQINVTTEKEKKPLFGTRIVLFKPDGDREVLVKVLTSDKNGTVPPVSLPAAPSKRTPPAGCSSPSFYTIEASQKGYYPVRHIHIPLCGGVASVLNIELTPLSEDGEPSKEIVYDHFLCPQNP